MKSKFLRDPVSIDEGIILSTPSVARIDHCHGHVARILSRPFGIEQRESAVISDIDITFFSKKTSLREGRLFEQLSVGKSRAVLHVQNMMRTDRNDDTSEEPGAIA